MARRRKRRLKKGPVLLLFIIVVCLGVGLKNGFNHFFDKDSSNDKNNVQTPDNGKQNTNKDNDEKEKTYKLSLLATGDGLIHNAIFRTYHT
ncbi:MAG: hypothetical protein K2M17_02490, partial [Bacilli bacterium]|nr:hypothetical protein [Bacilli bacterium]